MDFNYLNHVVEYGFEKKNGPIKTIDEYDNDFLKLETSFYACFYRFYNSVPKNKSIVNIIKIYAYKTDKFIENRDNHIFLFNLVEANLWLREIKKIIHFEYRIIKSKDSESGDKYEIRLLIPGSLLKAKFITTLVRYLFEWPLVNILKESIWLKKNKKVRDDLSLFDIFCLMSLFTLNINSNHALLIEDDLIKKFYSYQEIADRILKSNIEQLHNVIECEDYNNNRLLSPLYKNISEIYESNKTNWEKCENIRELIKYYNSANIADRYENLYKPILNEFIKYIER